MIAATESQLADQFVRLCARLGLHESLHGVCHELLAGLEQGHVCLDLGRDPERLAALGPLLHESSFVLCGNEITGRSVRPLVFFEDRLYLYRYFRYEQELAAFVRARLQRKPARPDPGTVVQLLDRLFPKAAEPTDLFNWREQSIDRQRLAAALATTGSLLVISGGPGTGKTSTVARILKLLRAQNPESRVALAAPTGKAALRLRESLSRIGSESVTEEVSTLHRLLGRGKTGLRYRYDRENPLAVDWLVVDEASMIDLPLLHATFAALPEAAGIILLGDHHQLASVEAGAVLGELCADGMGFHANFARELMELYGAPAAVDELPLLGKDERRTLPDALVVLEKIYRIDSGSQSLAGLAMAVRDGHGRRALELLKSSGSGRGQAGIRLVGNDQQGREELEQILEAVCAPFMAARTAPEALQALGKTQILCDTNHGPLGARRFNEIARGRLIGPRAAFQSDLPRGTPIMIRRNDYELGLFNGDTGVVFFDDDGAPPAAFFRESDEDAVRRVPLALLPAFEAAFAMTVHKSQGSEFNDVILILSGKNEALATRELVYTAITRARRSVTIFAEENSLRNAIERQTRRQMGLANMLRNEQPVVH